MSEAAAIEQAFRDNLPSKLHKDASGLAQILAQIFAQIAADEHSPDTLSKPIHITPALLQGLRDLNGKMVTTERSVLSIGAESQTGDVTIGSLVGGHQISLILLPSPPQSNWLLWATFGALITLAGGLTFWSYTPPGAPSAPNAPISTAASVPAAFPPAPAVPALVSTALAPAQPTLAPQLSTPVVQPTSAVRAFAAHCISERQLDLAEERIFLMETGANILILGPDDRRDQPIGLALSKSGQPLALVVLDIVQGQSYITRAVLDASCQPLPDSRFSNAEPSRLHMLQAWDTLLLCLASGAHRIRVGAPNHTPVEMLSRPLGEGAKCPS